MITLHVNLTAKEGRRDELEVAIREKWLPAMSEQPGFIRCAMLTPTSNDEFAEAGGTELQHDFDAVAFWETVEDLLTWAKSEVHAEATSPMVEAAANITSTTQDVVRSWEQWQA